MQKETHIFICGFPRSGTSLLYSLFTSFVNNNFFDKECSAAQVLHLEGSFITKRPFDCFVIEKIKNLNIRKKDLKCIFMVRDPRSIISSIHFLIPNDYFIGYESTYHIGKNSIVKTDPGIEKIFRIFTNLNNITVLKYEDLVLYPERTQKKLGYKFNFKYRGNFSDFSEKNKISRVWDFAMNKTRKLDTSRLNSWKNHPKRIQEQFSKFPELFNILQKLNYTKNNEWYKEFEK